MLISRTTGSASVVPELACADAGGAVGWLCETFGFTGLWRAGGHRARVASGNGVVVVADADARYGRAAPGSGGPRGYAVMVKAEDADARHDHAREHGARILSPPAGYPYGERRYAAEDLAGHHRTFTRAIAGPRPRGLGRNVREASQRPDLAVARRRHRRDRVRAGDSACGGPRPGLAWPGGAMTLAGGQRCTGRGIRSTREEVRRG